MALHARLTVTSEQGQSLGSNASHEFGATGGFIGRSAACDWCLPDPTHTLSARHAEIRFNGQGFVVIDLSTNGVYVNTTDAPIGRGNTAVLVNGDLIYLGPYVLSVEITKIKDEAVPARPAAGFAPSPAAMAPLGPPSGAAQPMFRTPPSAPPASNTTFRAPLDPLAALDGEDALDHHTDNPFSDIGIGRRNRDLTDSGLRSLTGFRATPSTPSYSAPAYAPPPPAPPPPPVGYPPMPAAAPAQPLGGAGSVIPADFDFSAPPSPPPPPPQPAAWAGFTPPPSPPPAPVVPPPPAPLDAGPSSIPPNFLEELSVLIPRLAEGSAPAPVPPAAPAPLAPPPQFVPPPAFTPPPQFAPPAPPAHHLSPDDPEDMVTMLRMRAKAKAPGASPAAPLQSPPLPQAMPHLQPPPAARPVPPPPPLPPVIQPAPPLPPPMVPAPPPVLAPAAPMRAQATEADFWALLGVDPAGLSPAERSRLLGESADLIRALVEGLIALQAIRRNLKGELHLEATQLSSEENPFKTALTPEQALSQSIGGRSNGRVDPGAAVHDVFNEMRIHEMASMEAMQATIARLMQRISPAAIAFEVEGEAPSGGVFARKADKMKLWDRYLLMHERLVDALDVISPELIGEEFSRAYAKHAETLRRGTA